MDWDVSKPVSFASGDHRHLVQKVANRGGYSKLGQSYMASSEGRSQDTKESPYPKAREQASIYVVQISENDCPNETSTDSSNPFADPPVRRAFIVKVFTILSIQLLTTAAITSLFVLMKGLRTWVTVHPLFIYALFPAFFVVFIVLACCGDLHRQVPANYILLGFFTLLQGLLLGGVSVFYNAEEVLWATGATTVVTLSLTLFALQTKLDFTLLNGVLFVCIIVLMIFGIVLIVVRTLWLHVLYAALGTVLFSMYLVMDVQLMVGGNHHSTLNAEEYVFAALNIYLDIINLFLFILQLIAMGR
ncbi:protein lifeguard 2 [Nannospalax galili]|nr:protein lifeguard 2 [Nannospalax galili]